MCLKVGTKTEQCPSCGVQFSGTKAGDAHRVGRHGIDRRCLSTEEMRAKKVEKGSLAGEPFFAVRRDKAGCEIWSVNTGQNPRSSMNGDDTEGRTALPWYQLPGSTLRPSVMPSGMEAAGAGVCRGRVQPLPHGLPAAAATATVPQGVC